MSEYRREYPVYRVYADALRRVLEHLCQQVAPLAIVQARAKSVSSFAEKALRKWPRRDDPVRQFTDLCGARVITVTQRERDLVREFIDNRFQVDEVEDTSTRLGATEFGYGSLHYVVRPTKEAFEGVPLPAAVRSVDALLERLGPRRAEIQVRTLMEHAWSDVMHDRLYKGRVNVPEAWRHAAARQAALLEQADREFSRMVEELDGLLEHHDAYMKPEEIDQEIATLSAVLASEPEVKNKAPLALKIARLCRQRRAWQGIIDRLTPLARGRALPEGDVGRAIRLELGRALCMAHRPPSAEHARGLTLLKAVARPEAEDTRPDVAGRVRPDPIRAEALATLAALNNGRGEPTGSARELYQMATALDPANPYLLIAMLAAEALWHHELRPLVPRIEDAARTCRAHADLGVELPRAYAGLAMCELFLGRYHECLAAYAKAVEKSDAHRIMDELDAIVGFKARVNNPPPELEWVARFLGLTHVAKLWQEATRDGLHDSTQAEAKKRTSGRTAPPALERLAREVAQSLGIAGIPGEERIRPPVIIIAGGTDPGFQDMGERNHLLAAFKGFGGTVISGGTRAGVAGLVGDLAGRERGLTALGYLPRQLPRGVSEDGRYARRYESDGAGFSPLEPLLYWAHILVSGIPPHTVRLLGMGGGRISTFEYRMALAMGATVGLIEGTGRAAAEILSEVDFWPIGRLLQLPDDRMTLRAFINPETPALSRKRVEAAARQAHEDYIKAALGQAANADISPWKSLRDSFKESNRQQVLYAAQILARHGYGIRDLQAPHADPVFTKREIESMAEMEHGRWVTERLRNGWRYGPTRDRERKISPYLVGWSQLPDRVKDFDRNSARKYPETLRKAGLGIYRMRTTSR